MDFDLGRLGTDARETSLRLLPLIWLNRGEFIFWNRTSGKFCKNRRNISRAKQAFAQFIANLNGL